MSNEQLADPSQPKRDQLAFVDLCVRFIGEIRHQDLAPHFNIPLMATNRNLAFHKDSVPDNVDYDVDGKSHILWLDFCPSIYSNQKFS